MDRLCGLFPSPAKSLQAQVTLRNFAIFLGGHSLLVKAQVRLTSSLFSVLLKEVKNLTCFVYFT